MNNAFHPAWPAGDASGRQSDGTPETSRLADGFSALAAKFQFSHYLLTTFPRGDQIGFAANLIVSNWPTTLLQAYGAEDVFGVSGLIAKLKTTVLPVFSGMRIFLRAVEGSETSELPAILTQAGLTNTLAFSLHDADLNHFIIALSGTGGPPSRSDCMEIVYRALTLLDEKPPGRRLPAPHEKLTAREIECLRWSAAGKSSEEIAIILSISSHTVVSYLKSAMRKLDAVNRMQAIARACRYRLL